MAYQTASQAIYHNDRDVLDRANELQARYSDLDYLEAVKWALDEEKEHA